MTKRERWLALIADNIAAHGHHITHVMPKLTPRYAYTLGLAARRGCEIVLAGAAEIRRAEVGALMNEIAAQELVEGGVVTGIGRSLALRRVNDAWLRGLLLGIPDHYRQQPMPTVLQVVPAPEQMTLDVPDMSMGAPSESPIWRWDADEWTGPVAGDGRFVARMGFLVGAAARHVIRVDRDEWHLESEPHPRDDERTVVTSVATALGIAPELREHLAIEIGDERWCAS